MKENQVIDVNIIGSMIMNNPDGEGDFVGTKVTRLELDLINEQTWKAFIDYVSNFNNVIDVQDLA